MPRASSARPIACLILTLVGLDCGDRPASAPPVPVAAGSVTTTAVDDGAPWWRSVVFYEIFVRSFADSTSGPLAEDGIGDLSGLIERLDYLNDGDPDTSTDLEIGGVWLMPVTQSPSYHGYDVVDYREIEKDYGTNADFRRLVRAAHARGIRVIVDLVLNHTSSRHPWFRHAWRERSPFHDWYIWAYSPHDYLGPWGQPVWHEPRWRQRGFTDSDYLGYYGVFWSGMPDLNYRNPAVTKEMLEVSRFWLDEMHVDGFRLDAIRHLIEDGQTQEDTAATHRWLRGFHREIHAIRPDAFTVGEVWAETDIVATYGQDELDATLQFGLAGAILEALKGGRAGPFTTEAERVAAAFPDGRYATFLTNHDQERLFSQLDRRLDRAKLAATLLLTMPGVPFLYYGEEIGMTGMKPDPLIRRPMQWSPARYAGFSGHRPWQDPDPEFARRTVADQDGDPDSLLTHYRCLVRLRNRHSALRVGSFAIVDVGHPSVAGFRRSHGDEQVLVLANLGDSPIDGSALALDSSTKQRHRDLLRGHDVALGREPFELAPVAAYVLSREMVREDTGVP